MKITGKEQNPHASPMDADVIVRGQLRAHLRALEATTGRKYVVVRDAITQRFVVQVLEAGTKTVLDQFPAENILEQLPRNE